MNEVQIKKYVRFVFVISFLIFIINKLYLRQWVLENNTSNIYLLLVNSIPNFAEAVIGTFLLTGILLQVRQYNRQRFGFIKDRTINILAVCLASIYVLSQELKFHNLGGSNVYDPNDIIASIIGLLLSFSIIQIFGFIDTSGNKQG